MVEEMSGANALRLLEEMDVRVIFAYLGGYWCTNRHFDKNIVGLLFFHHFHLKIWLSWHLAQQGKVQVVIK